MKQTTIALFTFIFITTNFFIANADVRLPSIIGNHMVLQQNTEVNIWGWCEPGEKIKINTSWDTTTYSTKGTSGAKWSLKIKTPIAGGPYTININGNNKIIIDDVLIGEVWDCSGQSNMEMSYGWGIKQYDADVSNSSNKSIHFFHIPKLTSDHPQDDIHGTWEVCDFYYFKAIQFSRIFFWVKNYNRFYLLRLGL